MAKISLSYPETGLIISISLKNRDTGIEIFSGVMSEISQIYKYDFIEEEGVDYIYTSFCNGYDSMSGTIYNEITTNLTTEGIAFAVDQKITLSHGEGTYVKGETYISGLGQMTGNQTFSEEFEVKIDEIRKLVKSIKKIDTGVLEQKIDQLRSEIPDLESIDRVVGERINIDHGVGLYNQTTDCSKMEDLLNTSVSESDNQFGMMKDFMNSKIENVIKSIEETLIGVGNKDSDDLVLVQGISDQLKEVKQVLFNEIEERIKKEKQEKIAKLQNLYEKL